MNELFYCIFWEQIYQGMNILITEMWEISFIDNTDFVWTTWDCINRLHLYRAEISKILLALPQTTTHLLLSTTWFTYWIYFYFLMLIKIFLTLWWYTELNRLYKQHSRKRELQLENYEKIFLRHLAGSIQSVKGKGEFYSFAEACNK